MAEIDGTPPEARDLSAEMDGFPILRDHTFVRITADEAIVQKRGAEFHLSMVVRGADPTFQFQSEKAASGRALPIQPVRVEGSLTEVARVRITGSSAFGMAMNIIEEAISSGAINIPLFRASIEEMLVEHEELDDSDPDTTVS